MDAASKPELQAYIDAYVSNLKSQGAIRSTEVELAFRTVPRHMLVARFYVPNKVFSSQAGYREVVSDPSDPRPEDLETIYSTSALITRLNGSFPTSSTSMPGLVAEMLELLRLEVGLRVLEIGAGTGYNAALISELVGSQRAVITVDIQEDVVDQTRRLLKSAGFGDIQVLARDGFYGVSEEAPFDRIVATVGLFDVSPHWVEQLSPAGEMLLPVYQGGAAPLLRLRVADGQLLAKVVGNSGFMPIQGEMRPHASSHGSTVEDGDGDVSLLPGWDLGPDRWAFWFFVTASDRRASLLPFPGSDDGDTWSKWTFGLAEGTSRVVIGADQVALVGEAVQPLLARLMELRELWEAQARPGADAYELLFVPKDDYRAREGVLAIERKYHMQVLSQEPRRLRA